MGSTHPPSRDLSNPGLFQVFWSPFKHICSNIAGADAIDSAKINPFHRKAFGQMNQAGLGGIILSSISEALDVSFWKANSQRPVFVVNYK